MPYGGEGEQKVNLLVCEKALQGYVSGLQSLVAVFIDNPSLAERAIQKVAAFVQDPTARRKTEVPDMGVFLATAKRQS